MRTFLRWLPLVLLLAGYDAYLLLYRLPEVQGNVEAQFIIITPGFILSHLLHRRHADAQHQERMAAHRATDVQLAAHRVEMTAVITKVGELHQFHIRGILPDGEIRP